LKPVFTADGEPKYTVSLAASYETTLPTSVSVRTEKPTRDEDSEHVAVPL
jgi:hypothetical protein